MLWCLLWAHVCGGSRCAVVLPRALLAFVWMGLTWQLLLVLVLSSFNLTIVASLLSASLSLLARWKCIEGFCICQLLCLALRAVGILPQTGKHITAQNSGACGNICVLPTVLARDDLAGYTVYHGWLAAFRSFSFLLALLNWELLRMIHLYGLMRRDLCLQQQILAFKQFEQSSFYLFTICLVWVDLFRPRTIWRLSLGWIRISV